MRAKWRGGGGGGATGRIENHAAGGRGAGGRAGGGGCVCIRARSRGPTGSGRGALGGVGVGVGVARTSRARAWGENNKKKCVPLLITPPPLLQPASSARVRFCLRAARPCASARAEPRAGGSVASGARSSGECRREDGPDGLKGWGGLCVKGFCQTGGTPRLACLTTQSWATTSASDRCPKDSLYTVSKSITSSLYVSSQPFSS